MLRKIKALQRREIEKRAEEFGKSETDAIKPFGYDLFASDPPPLPREMKYPFLPTIGLARETWSRFSCLDNAMILSAWEFPVKE